MSAIFRAMLLRFWRLRVGVLAFVVPAAAVAWAAARPPGPGGAELRAAEVLLLCLQFLLPPLAAAFLISASQEEPLDLLLVRPVGSTGIILGRWAGTMAAFGACHLVLSGSLGAALAAGGGGPAGRVDIVPRERLVRSGEGGPVPAGDLCRSWAASGKDPIWATRAEAVQEWIFLFDRLPPGRPLRARIHPFLGRIVDQDSDEAPGGPREKLLVRAVTVPALVSYDGAASRIEGGRIDLRDREAVHLEVPASAVDASGRLAIVLSKVVLEAGRSDGVTWGSPFFWFEGKDGVDPLATRDVRVAGGEIPFAANALLAAAGTLGELLLLGGLAVAAAALFSPGVAIGACLAAYLLATARPFLADVVGALSHESSLVLLSSSGSHEHGGGHGPTALDRALQAFLEGVLFLIPDLDRFRAAAWLGRGEAVRLLSLALSLATGGAYAAACIAVAALLGARKEAAR